MCGKCIVTSPVVHHSCWGMPIVSTHLCQLYVYLDAGVLHTTQFVWPRSGPSTSPLIRFMQHPCLHFPL